MSSTGHGMKVEPQLASTANVGNFLSSSHQGVITTRLYHHTKSLPCLSGSCWAAVSAEGHAGNDDAQRVQNLQYDCMFFMDSVREGATSGPCGC